MFGAKPLPEPMLTYCAIEPYGTNRSKILIKIQNFSFKRKHSNVVCEMAAILSRARWVERPFSQSVALYKFHCNLHILSRDIEACANRRLNHSNPIIWMFGASRLRHLVANVIAIHKGRVPFLRDIVKDFKRHNFSLGHAANLMVRLKWIGKHYLIGPMGDLNTILKCHFQSWFTFTDWYLQMFSW